MKKEQSDFLKILSDYVSEIAGFEYDIDVEAVKSIADRQRIAGLVYKQTKLDAFKSAFAFEVYRYTQIKHISKTIESILTEYSFLFLKGLAISEYYRWPENRYSGDIDIVIHKEDRTAIHEILLSNGFILDRQWNDEWVYKKNDVLVEVHDCLIHPNPGNKKLVDYFSKVWEYTENDHWLEINFHFIYLIHHLMHHIIDEGIGFRSFLDIALIGKKADLDWNWIEKELKRISLWDFAQNVFALVEKWFEIKLPVRTKEISDEFYMEVTGIVFDDGIYGHDNPRNKDITPARVMAYENTSLFQSRLRLLFRGVFMSYEDLTKNTRYKYLVNRKWLLPVAWIHRILHVIHDKKIVSGIKKNQNFAEQNVSDRVVYLKQWDIMK